MPDGGTITVGGGNLDLDSGGELPLPPGRYVKVFVRDRGVGISPENLPRLFDPYFTTKETGTGLGLAATWSIIRGHGGHIRADSEAGRGAVFTIYLPAAETIPEPEPSALPTAGDFTGRILVMDDEPEVREVLSRMLQFLGNKAETCRDGREALARYREARESGDPFDAVIMDLTIPGGMGGKEAVRELLEYDPGGRVIVSSGYSSEGIASDFREHGFRALLAKPYQMKDLREALGTVLGPER
jgi:CheY-like chemotaxis protein